MSYEFLNDLYEVAQIQATTESNRIKKSLIKTLALGPDLMQDYVQGLTDELAVDPHLTQVTDDKEESKIMAAAEKAAADKVLADRAAFDKAKADKTKADKAAADKAKAEKAKADIVAKKAAADKAKAEKAAVEKAAADKAAVERTAAVAEEVKRRAAEKAAAEKAEKAEKAEEEATTDNTEENAFYDDLGAEGVDVESTVDPDIMKGYMDAPFMMIDGVEKEGPHPFFKGSVGYLAYLPSDARLKYLMHVDDGTIDEYPDRLSLAHPDEFEKMCKIGINKELAEDLLLGLMSGILEPSHDKGTIEVLKTEKAQGKLQDIVSKIPNGGKLFKLMARAGVNQQMLKDLQIIVHEYLENPNPYIWEGV